MKKRSYLTGALFLVILSGVACQGFDEQLILNKASRHFDAGNFNEAIRLYSMVIAKDPDNKVPPDKSVARYELGMAYLDIGKEVKALEQVEILRKWKRPDLSEPLYMETKRKKYK